MAEKITLDAKKRERFQKLKEQFAKEQEVFLWLNCNECISSARNWKHIYVHISQTVSTKWFLF